MNESDDPFRNEQPENNSEVMPEEEIASTPRTPMSRELAEEVKVQAEISGAGKPLSRYKAGQEGFQPPQGPSLKDRLEADRTLREHENPEDQVDSA